MNKCDIILTFLCIQNNDDVEAFFFLAGPKFCRESNVVHERVEASAGKQMKELSSTKDDLWVFDEIAFIVSCHVLML